MKQQEQGFTILEVMIAILIATIFVATAMQMMAMAAAFKARARQYAEATTWIQADLEVVKDQADQLPLPSTTLTADVAAGATDLTVNSISGFAAGDIIKVGSNSSTYTISAITTSTKIITISSPGIATAQTTGSQVVARCKLSPLTPSTTTGIGDYLNDNLPSLTTSNPNSGDTTILGRNFNLFRISKVKNVDPYEILELFYGVASQDTRTTLSAAAAATSTTLTVASASGFKVGDTLIVGGTDFDNEIQSISGNTVTLTAQLGSAQSSGATVDAPIAVLNTEVMPNAALQCPK